MSGGQEDVGAGPLWSPVWGEQVTRLIHQSVLLLTDKP